MLGQRAISDSELPFLGLKALTAAVCGVTGAVTVSLKATQVALELKVAFWGICADS
jgi:hypothetical protein